MAAKSAKLDVVGSAEYERRATDYTSLASGVAQTRPDCVLIGAITEDHAVQVTRQIAAALPNARIFAPAGLAESTFVDPGQGGIPVSIDPRVLITVAAFDRLLLPRIGQSLPGRLHASIRTAGAVCDLRV